MLKIKYLNFVFAFFMMFFGTSLIGESISDIGIVQAAVATADETAKKEESCGVSSNGDVIPRNFSICREDISYNALYMSFAKIFNEFPVLSAFLYDEESKLDDKGYASSIGGSTIALLTGFTYLILFTGLVIFSYATTKVLYLSSQSGQFLNGSASRKFLILRSIAILVAITPVGSISLSQLIVFFVAILSIMGGNFFHSTFIANLQEESVKVDFNSSITEGKAISYSNSLITSNLCQIRTTKALTQKNIYIYSNNIFSKRDFDIQSDIISACINPTDNFRVKFNFAKYTSDNTMFFGSGDDRKYFRTGGVSNLRIGGDNYCSVDGSSNIYKEEQHGRDYNCGEITFDVPQISKYNKEEAVHKSNEVRIDDYIKRVDVAVMKTYNDYNLYEALNDYIDIILDNQEDFDFFIHLKEKVSEFTDVIFEHGKEVYISANDEYNHKTAVAILYMYLSLVQSNLLGSRSYNSENLRKNVSASENKNENTNDPREISLKTYGSTAWNYLDADYLRVLKNDSYDILSKYSKSAAFALDEAHCVENFEKFQDATSKTYKSLNENKSNNWADFEKNGTFFGECIWFLDKGRDLELPFGDVSTNIDVSKHSSFFITAGSLSKNYLNFDMERDLKSVLEIKPLEVQRLNSKSNLNRLAIASNYYVVVNSIGDGFGKILENEVDKDLPKRMRKQGWASLGGLILGMTSNHIDASSFLVKLTNSVYWNSRFDNIITGSYINKDSYGSADARDKYVDVFTDLDLSVFFSSYQVATELNGSGNVVKDGLPDGEGYMEQIARWLENLLTHPLRYIKNIGGLDKKLTIREGIEKCYKEGNCSTGDMHPLSALVYMGNDLLDISITYFVIKIVVDGLAKVLNTIVGEESNSGVIEGFKKLIPGFALLSAGKVAMNGLSAVLNVLSTPMFLIFMLGLFFSYLLPLMPYIIYLMQVIGWIVLIYTLLFSVQIWLMMIFVPSSTGEPRGDVKLIWQHIGQLIFKPSFIVIGLVIGWYMTSVLIYIVNMTFFGVISALSETSSGFIRPVLDMIMFYITYLIVIIVVMKYSFQMITNFPDLASKAINLKDSTDQGVKSAISDRLLTAAVMQQIVSQTASGVSRSIGEEVKGKFNKIESDRRTDQSIKDAVSDKFDERYGSKGLNNDMDDITKPSENFADSENFDSNADSTADSNTGSNADSTADSNTGSNTGSNNSTVARGNSHSETTNEFNNIVSEGERRGAEERNSYDENAPVETLADSTYSPNFDNNNNTADADGGKDVKDIKDDEDIV